LIYAAIVRFGRPHAQDLSYWFEDDTISVAIPEDGYIEGMAYSGDESHEEIAYHAFLGLEANDLVEGGTRVYKPDRHSEFDVPFRFFWPTRYGFELFLWGLGIGKTRVSSYFDLDPTISLPTEPPFKALGIELGKRHYR
jgi:hypothetical protein